MSKFHERLVADRRDGTAAPQVAQMLEAGVTPPGAPGAGAVGDIELTAIDGFPDFRKCSRCGVVVVAAAGGTHIRFHAEAGA